MVYIYFGRQIEMHRALLEKTTFKIIKVFYQMLKSQPGAENRLSTIKLLPELIDLISEKEMTQAGLTTEYLKYLYIQLNVSYRKWLIVKLTQTREQIEIQIYNLCNDFFARLLILSPFEVSLKYMH